MTKDQVDEWAVFYELEPWGSLREDRRAGTIAAVIANHAFGRSKDSKPCMPSDFFASLKESPRVQTQQEMLATILAQTQVRGGKVKTMSRK